MLQGRRAGKFIFTTLFLFFMIPWVNSFCAICAELIEFELTKPQPNMDQIKKWLLWIKQNCHTTATPKGEIPPQLKPYLFQEGEGYGIVGTQVVDGKLMPKNAARRKKRTI